MLVILNIILMLQLGAFVLLLSVGIDLRRLFKLRHGLERTIEDLERENRTLRKLTQLPD